MRNDRAALVAVVFLSITAYELGALLIVVSGLQLLMLSNVVPAALTSAYMVLAHHRASRNPARKEGAKMRVPFLVFGLIVIPVASSVALFLMHPFPVYVLIISFATELTFLGIFFYLPLSIYDRFSWRYKALPGKDARYTPRLSIIIPAYNEEQLIERTIESVIEADYPYKQIIVIDDGSTDQTYRKAMKYRSRLSADKFMVIRKSNGGKTSALNYGLCFATGEIIVALDADSIISRNSLRILARQFLDPAVVAVASKVKNLRTTNALQNCISMETVLGTNLVRGPFNVFGTVMIIPGAGGAFRKEALVACGKYDNDTVTEDFDVTVKLLRSKGRVVLVDAITYTEVPDNLRDLRKQRDRWARGNMQTLLKHIDVLSNGRYGMLHKFGYPILSMGYWLPSLLDFLIIGYTAYVLLMGMGPSFLLPFGLYMGWQIVLTAIAIIMDGKESGRQLLYSPLAIFGYKQILNAINLKAMLGVVFSKDRSAKWQAAKPSPMPA